MKHGRSAFIKKLCRCEVCKHAHREYNQAWHASNAQRINTERRVSGYYVKYYAANKERYAERYAAERERYASYPRDVERSRTQAAAWRIANPEAKRQQESRRRARMRGNDVRVVTERDWRRLCERYNNRCAYCGAAAPLTQDHIMPIIRGGRHAIGNLLPACKPCNSSKKTSLLVEWRRRRVTSTQLAS